MTLVGEWRLPRVGRFQTIVRSMNSSAASPYSTGGGGTVLEHRYGATLLTHVLSGAPLYELGDTAAPLSVKFQAGSVSDTDDSWFEECWRMKVKCVLLSESDAIL